MKCVIRLGTTRMQYDSADKATAANAKKLYAALMGDIGGIGVKLPDGEMYIEAEIKTCPFCGSENVAVDGKMFPSVICTDCKAYGPVGRNIQDAIEKWNRTSERADGVKYTFKEAVDD